MIRKSVIVIQPMAHKYKGKGEGKDGEGKGGKGKEVRAGRTFNALTLASTAAQAAQESGRDVRAFNALAMASSSSATTAKTTTTITKTEARLMLQLDDATQRVEQAETDMREAQTEVVTTAEISKSWQRRAAAAKARAKSASVSLTEAHEDLERVQKRLKHFYQLNSNPKATTANFKERFDKVFTSDDELSQVVIDHADH